MTKEGASELRQIADGATRHVQILKALNRPTDAWDDLLIYIIGSKLDTSTAREWQSTLEGVELPSMKQFFDFLSHRCRVLESTDKQSGAVAKMINLRLHSNAKQKVSCNSVIKAKCEYCRGAHFIYQCPQFLALLIPNRIAEARARKLCLNCLRSTDHVSSKCPSGVCRTCSRKHNTLLHLQQASSDQLKSGNSERAATGSSESAPLDSVAVHASNVTEGKCALLSTAVVFAQANYGSRKPCRILLDSGSQVNLISRSFSIL